MRLGRIDIFPLTDGQFRLDGGAMFGIVPKVLWEKCCPADEHNRISLSLTPRLIKAGGKNILVDTGIGGKQDPKFQKMFAIDRRPSLADSLKKVGLGFDDIHMVINTHLHFDHAGGNTARDTAGHIVPSFPKAKYFIQRGEFDDGYGRTSEPRGATARRTSRRSTSTSSGSSWMGTPSCSQACPPWSPKAIPPIIRA